MSKSNKLQIEMMDLARKSALEKAAKATGEEADHLKDLADDLEEQLNKLRAENDAAATQPSDVLKAVRREKNLRVVKKVLMWTGAAAGAVLVGAITYKYFKKSPVELVAEVTEEAL